MIVHPINTGRVSGNGISRRDVCMRLLGFGPMKYMIQSVKSKLLNAESKYLHVDFSKSVVILKVVAGKKENILD